MFKHDLTSLSVFSHRAVRVVISVFIDSCLDILESKKKAKLILGISATSLQMDQSVIPITVACMCLRFRNQVKLEASVIMGLLIGDFQVNSTRKMPGVVCLHLVVGSKSDDFKLL